MASGVPSKPTGDNAAASPASKAEQPAQKTAAPLEEDDEFEDFPVEDWPAEETEAAATAASGDAAGTTTGHLWEESWDDDDTTDDFSAQLREELKKVEASKRR
ncbi:26 proteasome complex subunit DSS1 [Microdochium nivale]|nr:26 proteasome complex subunit DSS1 [Microdochium nivale]